MSDSATQSKAPAASAASRARQLAHAYGEAASETFNSTCSLIDAPDPGAFFHDNLPCEHTFSSGEFFHLALASAYPMHEDNRGPGSGDTGVSLSDLWKGRLGGDEPQVDRRISRTRPMAPN